MKYVSSLAVPKADTSSALEEDEGPSVVTFLIKQGTDVNATDHNGLTPLHLCCIRGSIQSAKELLESSLCDYAVRNIIVHNLQLQNSEPEQLFQPTPKFKEAYRPVATFTDLPYLGFAPHQIFTSNLPRLTFDARIATLDTS
jgi:ankyrin repeat protein